MPPRLRARLFLRGAAKFLAVAAIAVVLGALLGIGLSELSGDDNVASTPTDAPTTANTAAPTAPGSAAGAPRVEVMSAVLLSATTQSGRSRKRARLTVRVRVTNRSSTPLSSPDPRLISGDARVRVDPNAADAAGPLLKPLAAGATATGVLRFETAGAVTQRLASERRAQLRIANRTVAVRVEGG